MQLHVNGKVDKKTGRERDRERERWKTLMVKLYHWDAGILASDH